MKIDLTRTFEREEQGWSFRRALEALLLELDDASADLLALQLREGRGAWLTQLGSSGGRALFVGSALSGTITALALQGYQVNVIDADAGRRRLCAFRAREQTPGRVELAEHPSGPYALVVFEDGLPASQQGLAECEALLASDGELVLVGDNRLAYKRSLGRKGAFRVPRPVEFLRLAVTGELRERTLRGYRRALAIGRVRTVEGFALYPHRLDYSHVVALERDYPALSIGPMEKKNWLKLAGKALGLFPVLAPSFALIGRRSSGTKRIERVLGALAEKLGERTPAVEAVVATRGNSAVVHTREGAAWTLHIPLAPKNLRQTEHHLRVLGDVRARFPGVPVPEPLFFGTLEGLTFACERRLPGWTAPQACGDALRIGRMLGQVADALAKLVVRPSRTFDEADFETQVRARFRLVLEHASVPSTIQRLERMLAEARAKLVGRPLPLVFYHADVRAHPRLGHGGARGPALLRPPAPRRARGEAGARHQRRRGLAAPARARAARVRARVPRALSQGHRPRAGRRARDRGALPGARGRDGGEELGLLAPALAAAAVRDLRLAAICAARGSPRP